jgi:hypothetical protein
MRPSDANRFSRTCCRGDLGRGIDVGPPPDDVQLQRPARRREQHDLRRRRDHRARVRAGDRQRDAAGTRSAHDRHPGRKHVDAAEPRHVGGRRRGLPWGDLDARDGHGPVGTRRGEHPARQPLRDLATTVTRETRARSSVRRRRARWSAPTSSSTSPRSAPYRLRERMRDDELGPPSSALARDRTLRGRRQLERCS